MLQADELWKNFALWMKHLVNEVFTDAKKLKVVVDNLNNYDYYFILERFEFKKWLN